MLGLRSGSHAAWSEPDFPGPSRRRRPEGDPTMARRIEQHFVDVLSYAFYAVLIASTFVI